MCDENITAQNLLRLPAVKQRVSLSGPTIWRLIKRGDFPVPVKVGPRAVAWLQPEIDGWIADRAAARPLQNGRG